MQLIESNNNTFIPRFLILAMSSGCLYSSICWMALGRFFWIESILVVLSVFYVYTHLINQNSTKSYRFFGRVLGGVFQVFSPKNYLDFLIVFALIGMLLFFVVNPIYWILLIILISFYSIKFFL